MTQERQFQSGYSVQQYPDGFDIVHPERPVVRVRLSPTCWLLENTHTNEEGIPFGVTVIPIGLYARHELVRRVSGLSMRSWQPRKRFPGDWKIVEWARRQAGRPIGSLIRQEAARLLPARISASVLNVQRALFKNTLNCCSLAMQPRFYQKASRFLLNDLNRYSAASAAFWLQSDEVGSGVELAGWASLDPRSYQGSDELDSLIDQSVAELENWRLMFSDVGKTYPALNRTLDQLPGRVPSFLLSRLRYLHLSRAIHDRVELIFVLGSLPRVAEQFKDLVQFSRRDQILAAMAYVAKALQWQLSPKRASHITRCAWLLAAVREGRYRSLTSLARAAVQEYRELQRREALFEASLTPDKPTSAPPIEVPEIPGLTFLGTIGEIRDAAVEFDNCLANYVKRAVTGQSFLFRYQSDDGIAAAEVSFDGRVLQSLGPANESTPAAARLAEALIPWGQSFPNYPTDQSSCTLGLGF